MVSDTVSLWVVLHTHTHTRTHTRTHRVQEKLEMQEIGRHYYNPRLRKEVQEHK